MSWLLEQILGYKVNGENSLQPPILMEDGSENLDALYLTPCIFRDQPKEVNLVTERDTEEIKEIYLRLCKQMRRNRYSRRVNYKPNANRKERREYAVVIIDSLACVTGK